MPDFRVYTPAASPDAATITLSPDESHHLIVVNRARSGDPVVAFDGRGHEWDATLTEASKRAAVLRVARHRTATPLPFTIALAQALPKGPGMDAIVRKATEIGAAQIIPLVTERTQVHLDENRQEKKTDKWHIAALEAAKQCGNPWIPEILPVQRFESFVTHGTEAYELKLIASLHAGATSLRAALADFCSAQGRAPCRALWLIGPEGDFSPAEVEQAVAHGFRPITLGPLVLRCETAATYALAVLSHELSQV